MYRAALFEIQGSERPARIAEAEKAVVLRARDLFQAAGNNGEETRHSTTRCTLCTLCEATTTIWECPSLLSFYR